MHLFHQLKPSFLHQNPLSQGKLFSGFSFASSCTCVLASIQRFSSVRSAKRFCSRLGKVGSGSDRRRIGGNGPESVADGRFPGPRPERNSPRPATCRSGAPRSRIPSCCPGPLQAGQCTFPLRNSCFEDPNSQIFPLRG